MSLFKKYNSMEEVLADAEKKYPNDASAKANFIEAQRIKLENRTGEKIEAPVANREGVYEMPKSEAPEIPSKPAQQDLGEGGTEGWVKRQKEAGKTDDEIAQAYEAAGYSREGEKFKAAMQKYATPERPDTTPTNAPAYSERAEKSKQIGLWLGQNVIDAYKQGWFGPKGEKNTKLKMGMAILEQIGAALARFGGATKEEVGETSFEKIRSGMSERVKEVNQQIAELRAQRQELIQKRNAIKSGEFNAESFGRIVADYVTSGKGIQSVTSQRSEGSEKGAKGGLGIPGWVDVGGNYGLKAEVLQSGNRDAIASELYKLGKLEADKAQKAINEMRDGLIADIDAQIQQINDQIAQLESTLPNTKEEPKAGNKAAPEEKPEAAQEETK